MNIDRHTRHVIVRLLSNMGSAKEIQQYLRRFSRIDRTRFAVVKVGGAVLRDELDALASSLSFLQRVGLVPIVIHGAGPQLDQALAEAGIESETQGGLRRTSPEALAVARQVFLRENLRLVEALQRLDTRATSITSGVFEADWLDRETYGLVGSVRRVRLDAVRASVDANSLPVLSSLGETPTGQILNINADVAANELVRAIEPYKIIFLTATGGLLDNENRVIPSINLTTDYDRLMAEDWIHSGMRLKLEQIGALLADLPPSTSVSITRPDGLPRELFTHRGSGTLIRKGEQITVLQDWRDVDRGQLRTLLESSFRRPLVDDYFERTPLYRAYVTDSYRAAAILTNEVGIAHLDKFAVSDEARGEGLGRAVWQRLCADHPQLYWRSRIDNPINDFYFQESDGCLRKDNWRVFWRGLDDLEQIAQCVKAASERPETLHSETYNG